MEEPVIPCQRCGKPEATVAYGWALLCPQCKKNDDLFYEDKQAANIITE